MPYTRRNQHLRRLRALQLHKIQSRTEASGSAQSNPQRAVKTPAETVRLAKREIQREARWNLEQKLRRSSGKAES